MTTVCIYNFYLSQVVLGCKYPQIYKTSLKYYLKWNKSSLRYFFKYVFFFFFLNTEYFISRQESIVIVSKFTYRKLTDKDKFSNQNQIFL